MSDSPKRVIHVAIVSSDRQNAEDKSSIPDQLARQRARSTANGWRVIDEIVVDFSRRYYTYQEYAAAALEQGEPAPMRMFDHWRARSFDILSCRALDRLGREQSILAEVVARTIDMGATIAPLDEALVDKSNYRFASAMAGLNAAQYVDSLVKFREMGMSTKALNGKKSGNTPPRFWIERDSILTPDPNTRHIVNDAARLFLEGVSYHQFEDEMFARFGYGENGKRYTYHTFRKLLTDPRAYGHAVWGFRRPGSDDKRKTTPTGLWIIDPVNHAPPQSITVNANVLEPQWEGALLESVKSEFVRRVTIINGKARPQHTHIFSGLLYCKTCGRRMVISLGGTADRRYNYYMCATKYLYKRYPESNALCSNTLRISEPAVMETVNNLLEQAVTVNDINRLFGSPLPDRNFERIQAINHEIEDLETSRANLLEKLEHVNARDSQWIMNRLNELNDARNQKLGAIARIESETHANERVIRQQHAAFETLRAQTLADFWNMPPTQINQRLLTIYGNWRLFVLDRKIVSIEELID